MSSENQRRARVVKALKDNKPMINALLFFPIIGIIIGLALIYYKNPNNSTVIMGVITLLLIQYTLTVYFFSKRIDKMITELEISLSEPE